MSTVIETLAEYVTYLKYEKHLKDATLRKVDLSMRYFTELFGLTETKALKISDMYIFYEWLKGRRCKKRKNKEVKSFESAYLQKIMRHVKAYIKRLSDKAMLNDLVPADVPRGRVKAKLPSFLTKEDMTAIFHCLELNVANALVEGDKKAIYDAYLWRAVIRMLYTSGLRNFELRGLTYEDVNIEQMCGTVLGKGDKHAVFTFSDKTKNVLTEYLNYRESLFPDSAFQYIFSLYEKGTATPLTEQKLNIGVKQAGVKAGVKKNVHVHLLRHTLATHLIMYYNRNLVDVRDKLRHSNIAVTSIYLASNPITIKSMTSTLGNDLMAF